MNMLSDLNSEIGSSLPLPQPPAELVRACVAGDYVIYIGAGMAAHAGLPTWKPLVTQLLDHVLEQNLVASEFGKSLKEALAQDQTDAVADGIVSSLSGQQEVLDFLKRTFDSGPKTPPREYRLIKQLKPGAVLTANLDRLLEYTYAGEQIPIYTHRDSDLLLEALSQRDFSC
jgi:hypothetical protein